MNQTYNVSLRQQYQPASVAYGPGLHAGYGTRLSRLEAADALVLDLQDHAARLWASVHADGYRRASGVLLRVRQSLHRDEIEARFRLAFEPASASPGSSSSRSSSGYSPPEPNS